MTERKDINSPAKLSIVVPCFNEEAAVPIFYTESMKVISVLSKSIQNFEAEFVFVDDGSTDNTLNILRNLSDKRTDRVVVHYVSFSRNFGKEAAILAGLQKAKGEYIVTLDVDLQDPPALIEQMFEAVVSEGYDCVGSRRVTRKGEPLIRSFFARLFYRIITKISDIEVVDGSRDFRLMTRKYVKAVLSLQERNRFSKGIFPWVGFKIKWFEYENIKRCSGTTKWSFWKLFLYSLDGIIAFSSKPLAWGSILGILLFIVTLTLTCIIVIRKLLFGDPVNGWASTLCAILFCSSIQLLTIGIVGQYLAKVYIEVKQRPLYIIQDER
jgi:glycosyltransferase involved in cell wall biosynthesis